MDTSGKDRTKSKRTAASGPTRDQSYGRLLSRYVEKIEHKETKV